MTQIRIKAIDIYHPQHTLDNDYYIRHYEERGKDITNFMAHMGRKQRYLINNEQENTLTMGIAAAEKVLEQAGMSGSDLDMIVFSTQVPETTFPTNALRLHNALSANHYAMVMDSNANCAGMTVAVDNACRYMQSNQDIKTALIVGSDYNSLISNPETEITYANYGDAAAAVILERCEEEVGFIDSMYYTDSVLAERIKFPAEGLSQALKGTADGRYINWLPLDANSALPPAFDMIERLLTRHSLQPKDVKYCLSQFSLANILKIQENFSLDDSQLIYIGDEFGYTSTSSPFIALYRGIEAGTIKRGDHVLFWTIGSGFQLVSMLMKY